MSDMNQRIIDEFHTKDGIVSGPFDGANIVLLHHTGRRSGTGYVAPVVWFAGPPGAIHVVASAAGAPTHPQWYENLVAAGRATVEVGRGDGVGGIDTHDVTVRELDGEERDRVYADIVRQAPFFGTYAEKTAGVRTIPVLELTRS
ncbi:deazaflavin-dependent oxidoreductase, nitroreductase family [Jatrophihabitans endophyticus]|uniref:Deazaflavin-dependent oxidoreductase, nitroreductase family n=1 Tax=Jatrophihabitans endophyticus TaxID=1206085 RepID=A0A1M5LKB1_9ACTN|nr:nitroreductase family deazaflavin-dependent oxidoreductase [Jatrophihabitans endophyticus]SHG65481.1 deazaflavin-dependent oxidoreductase, nitroreductase family [Jatrophihabitans endophyticus]